MDEPAALLYACEFDSSGYAVAARRYLRAAQSAQQPVAWQPLVNTHHGRLCTDSANTAPNELLDLMRDVDGSHVTLAHCMPQSWAALRRELGGTRFIGQTVWETSSVPRRWTTELAPADEIWVPTQWNADTLREGGVEVPVHVVPHMVDHVVAETPPIDVHPSRFVFASINTWDWRKRPDLLLHAYLSAFTAADDVTLVLKTTPRVVSWRTGGTIERDTWWQVMQIVRQYPDAADVMLVTDEWTDAEVGGLMQRADCYVSLTSVEGWGLGAFDAAAAGTPLIITGYGGQMEWLGNDHSGLVPFTIVPADHPDRSMFEAGMTWALADVDAAVDLMRSAVHGSPAFVADAPALSARLSRQYSATSVGTVMRKLLR